MTRWSVQRQQHDNQNRKHAEQLKYVCFFLFHRLFTLSKMTAITGEAAVFPSRNVWELFLLVFASHLNTDKLCALFFFSSVLKIYLKCITDWSCQQKASVMFKSCSQRMEGFSAAVLVWIRENEQLGWSQPATSSAVGLWLPYGVRSARESSFRVFVQAQ